MLLNQDVAMSCGYAKGLLLLINIKNLMFVLLLCLYAQEEQIHGSMLNN